MRSTGGYVRVHRSLLDWEWYDDDACVRMMIHLLLTVNWEPKEWHGQKIAPGQLVTSMEKLAEKLRVSRASIRRTISKLRSTGDIAVHTNNHWTTITLVNWGEYQELQPTNGRQKSRPTADQRPTTDRPAATTKEGKEGEEGKNVGARAVVSMSFDEFRTACLNVHRSEKILTNEQSKAFFDYWTEGHPDTKPRYARKDVFDIAKRMRTWASKETTRAAEPPKSSTLKPWVN